MRTKSIARSAVTKMFIPHTDSEREEMLRVIGVKNLEDLFHDVPVAYRFPHLNLPPALTEMEIAAELQDLAAANESTHELISFLGAGAYNHYIPAVVDSVIRRGEFLTAYTPYQPEVSQGTLQAIFEYQSLICSLPAWKSVMPLTTMVPPPQQKQELWPTIISVGNAEKFLSLQRSIPSIAMYSARIFVGMKI